MNKHTSVFGACFSSETTIETKINIIKLYFLSVMITVHHSLVVMQHTLSAHLILHYIITVVNGREESIKCLDKVVGPGVTLQYKGLFTYFPENNAWILMKKEKTIWHI